MEAGGNNGINSVPPAYYAGPGTLPYPVGAPTGAPSPYAPSPYGCPPAGQAPGYWPPQPQPGAPPSQQPGFPPYQQPGVSPYQQPGNPPYPYMSPVAQPSLYPTLPSQDSSVVPDVGSPSAPPLEEPMAPTRPAPPPPIHGPGMVVGWQCTDGVKLYFLQHDGHCVAPDRKLKLVVYTQNKALGSRRSSTVSQTGEEILGCIEVPDVWKLNMKGNNSFVLHKSPDTYAFLDDSTDPSKSGRIVVLQLPEEVTTTMKSDLNNLMKEISQLRIEEQGYLGQITTGVGTVYEDGSKKASSFAKGYAPGVMQSTKAIRKGTGSLLRTGGSLLAKGMNLVANQVGEAPKTETVTPEHQHLGEAVENVYKHIQDKTVTMA